MVRHAYHVSEIPYFTVACEACLVVCNSGHHYRADEQGLAQAEARRHNAAEHRSSITLAERRLLADAATVLDRLAPTCAMSVRRWASRAEVAP